MAVFTALTGLVASVLTAVGLGAVATIGAQLIVGVGAALLSAALRPKPRSPAPEYQAVINQAVAPRRRGYGRAKLGGVRAFWDARDDHLYQVIMMHSGRISEVMQWWIGDIAVDVNNDGEVSTEPFDNEYAYIWFRNGGDDPAPYEKLLEEWPDVWTNQHQLKGITTALVVFDMPDVEDISKVFPEAHNTPVRIEARLSPVFDPRTDEFGWSDNPSLCIRDYLIHADGYRLDREDLYGASFAAFADAWAGKFRLWGLYSLEDDPKEVLRRMLATCDGELYEDHLGRVGIRGGIWEEPTVTITERDILSYDLEQGRDRFGAFNELKIEYTDPRQDYQPTEAQAWVQRAQQEESGQRIIEPFVVDMVPSPIQARRLAKIYFHKENPDWRGTITTNLVGLLARGERHIRLVIPEMKINDVFRVLDHGIVIDGLPVGCEIAVSSIRQKAYDWEDSEVGEDPETPIDTPPNIVVEKPTGLSLAVEVRAIAAGVSASVVVATADDPVRRHMRLEGQIRLGPAGDWEAMRTSANGRRAVSEYVEDGEDYEVRVRWRTPTDAASAWTDPEGVTV